MREKTRAARFRELIAQGCVSMPGVPNAAIARQVERAGFEAVYISGAGLANATAGVPDIGLLSLNEVAQLAGYVVEAVRIPCVVDADTGFGGAENVARTIHQLERAGLAGCHIEDQEFPKRCGHLAGKSLVDADEMAGKRRALRYIEAGADAIFPEALQSEQEFRDFATAVRVPLVANMTEFGKSPLLTMDDLRDFGYRMVIFPMSAFRVAMKASEKFLRDLKMRGSQAEWIDEMQTRQELYELLDYDPNAEEWLG